MNLQCPERKRKCKELRNKIAEKTKELKAFSFRGFNEIVRNIAKKYEDPISTYNVLKNYIKPYNTCSSEYAVELLTTYNSQLNIKLNHLKKQSAAAA